MREEEPPKQPEAEPFPPLPQFATNTNHQTEKGGASFNMNKVQRGAKRWMKSPPWKGGKGQSKGKQKDKNQQKGKGYWGQKGKAKGR